MNENMSLFADHSELKTLLISHYYYEPAPNQKEKKLFYQYRKLFEYIYQRPF